MLLRPGSRILNPFLLLALVALVLLPSATCFPSLLRAAPARFADNAFQQTWDYTDAPVASGQVQRSWYWGPAPGATSNEPYSGSKSGTRLVQYFDKARMEINNPGGDRKSEWFVTTGLLVAEMVSGKLQVGDKEFKTMRAAEIAVGGDGLSTDPDAPTYTAFRPMASLTGPGANRAPNRIGKPATSTIDRAGKVADNPAMGLYPGAKMAAYSEPLGHNIPQAMWEFLNLKGTVRKNGVNVEGQTIANWVYVMGYPITEPYWARVKIGGIYQDALFQLFQRRALAYVPAMPKGWQVQMANVGQHYYTWVYGGPLPTPLVALGTPTRPALPPSLDGEVSPQYVAPGTPVVVSISGFLPTEEIVSWFTSPDGNASDTRYNLTAGLDGTVDAISISTLGMQQGVWAITYHGKSSNHESIVYFAVTTSVPTPQDTKSPVAATATRTSVRSTATRTPSSQGTRVPTATVPVVPTEPAGGLSISIRPGYGAPSTQFIFTARGLQSGERVQVKFTDPTGAVVYPSGSNDGQYAADATGSLQITLVPEQAFPAAPLGIWLWEVRGLQSTLEGVVGFTLR